MVKVRRRPNLSRKDVERIRHAKVEAKREASVQQLALEKERRRQHLEKKEHRKTHVTFDAAKLDAVYQSMTETINSLGVPTTPLSLFAAAQTMLETAPVARDSVLPYAATIVAACSPKLSPGVLLSRVEPIARVCSRLIQEADGVNVLLCDKAYKAVATVAVSTVIAAAAVSPVDDSALATALDRALVAFKLTEPSRLHNTLTTTYLSALRTVVVRLWDATTPDASIDPSEETTPDGSVKRPLHADGRHALRRAMLTFFPDVIAGLLPCLHECTSGVAATALEHISTLARHIFGTAARDTPASVAAYLSCLDLTLAAVLNLFKSASPRSAWPAACDVCTSLFEKFSFVKRRYSPHRASPSAAGTSAALSLLNDVPNASLLLRVLDKIRQLEDACTLRSCENAILAIANTTTVESFMRVLPFNPHRDVMGRPAAGTITEAAATAEGSAAVSWSRSYVTASILRRVSHHDSIGFFVSEFLPRIEHCQKVINECRMAADPSLKVTEMQLFAALHEQYWRIAASFCEFPHDITIDSFRHLAKALVGLLTTPLVDVASLAIYNLCSGYHDLATKTDAAEGLDDDDDDDDGDLREVDALLDTTDANMNPHMYHDISRDRAKFVCEGIIAKYSANIMPKLCNAYEAHASSGVLRAIRSFAAICAPAVMKTILDGILSVAANVSSQVVSSGAAGEGPKMNEKRRFVLDLAGEVIPQLPTEHVIALLEQVVIPVLEETDDVPAGTDDDQALSVRQQIRQVDRAMQKKCYRLLKDMFQHRLSDMMPQLGRVERLLIAGQVPCLAGSLKLRLACLGWLVDAVKMYRPAALGSEIGHVIAEVVLCVKERSNAVRETAMDLLGKFHGYLSNQPGGATPLLHHVVAGLAAKTPMMLAASVTALAKILWCGVEVFAPGDVATAIGMILPLAAHAAPEVRASAALFIRAMLKLATRAQTVHAALQAGLPHMTRSIALVVSQPHVTSSTRVAMRQLTERLIKAFGESAVEAEFPLGSKRFFHYVAKQLRRTGRVKAADATEAADTSLLQLRARRMERVARRGGDDVPVDGDESDEDELAELKQQNRNGAARGHPAAASSERKAAPLDDDDGLVVNDGSGRIRILTVQQKRAEDDERSRKAQAARLFADAKRRGMARPSLGIDDINETHRKRSRTDAAVDYENDELIRLHGGDSGSGAQPAPSRGPAMFGTPAGGSTSGGGDGSLAGRPSRVTQQRRAAVVENRAAKKRRVESDIKTGEQFASKGTHGGDVKKGTQDPFAYVPLNRRFLNKRNRAVAKFRFKAVAAPTLKGDKAKAVTAKSK